MIPRLGGPDFDTPAGEHGVDRVSFRSILISGCWGTLATQRRSVSTLSAPSGRCWRSSCLIGGQVVAFWMRFLAPGFEPALQSGEPLTSKDIDFEGSSQAGVCLQGLAGDLRGGGVPATRLPAERLCEIVRQRDRGALHTRIPASDTRRMLQYSARRTPPPGTPQLGSRRAGGLDSLLCLDCSRRGAGVA